MGQSRKKKNRVLGKEKILDKYPVPLEKTLMHEYIETMRWWGTRGVLHSKAIAHMSMVDLWH